MDQNVPDSARTSRLDRWARFAGEELARSLDRRAFLKRAGSSAFLAVAGLASGRMFASVAQAAGGGATRPAPWPAAAGPYATPHCSPPGPYCNLSGVNQPDGCQGANCYEHLNNGKVVTCTLYYQYYAAGCWTAADSGGFWTCCDCSCSDGSHCGCAQFSGAPLHAVD